MIWTKKILHNRFWRYVGLYRLRFYGDVKYIGLLMDSNPQLLDISVFSDGTPVYIPELPEESDEDLPEWRV